MKNILLDKKTIIEPYSFHYRLIIARDGYAAEKKLFPKAESQGYFSASSYYDDYCFAALFHAEHVTKGNIAHELFHNTMRMLAWVGDKFDVEHSEPYAYLNGWLHNWVYRQLRENKIRIV